MKYTFKEYDCVSAKRDINDRVKKGVKGCIMVAHDTENFIVEFFVEDMIGNVEDVLTVTAADIQLDRKSFS